MANLYDEDFLLWSEQQAELLRRMATGDRVNDQVDWENVAEEIVDVGRSELRAVVSHLVQALLHDLKAEAWPLSREVPHWRAEARGHRDDARAAFTRSMAQREELEVAELYRRALRRMPETIDGVPPLPVPPECPVTLEELLAERETSGQ
jgi:hypothetical protein